mgnify:CR=1 FL=1
MTNPLIPGITAAEQDVLYQKLNEYNLKKASFKEAPILWYCQEQIVPDIHFGFTPLCPKGNPYFTYST